jgi:hypothetical protein
MKNNVGLWIDHRKAVIVSITDSGEEIQDIPSNMEPHVRFSGLSDVEESADDIRDRQYAGHLTHFYDEVIERIGDAEAVLILGPGEAKGELAKRLDSKGLKPRIAGVETADKMTNPQIAARVRRYFSD